MSFRYPFSPNKEVKIINKGLLLIVLCFLVTPTVSVAGSFIVSPLRIYFDSGAKTSVIKIINQDDKAVTIQLSAKKWSQNEIGPDTFEETREIVFFPRIVSLEKEEEQLIRVGYQGDKNLESEKTFRLFLNELPVNKTDGLALNFTLNIAVPIYVSPLKETKKPVIEKVGFSGDTLVVKVKNNGNTHFIVEKITASGINKRGNVVFEKDGNVQNVLAASARTFDINIPKGGCIKADKVRITAEVEGIILKEEFILDKNQCVSRKEDEKGPGGQSGK